MAKATPDQKAGEAATAAANPLEFHVYGPLATCRAPTGEISLAQAGQYTRAL
jgi:hypothetical protein